MEFYELTSLIEDYLFGDEKTLREMYVAVTNPVVRNRSLRGRLQIFAREHCVCR